MEALKQEVSDGKDGEELHWQVNRCSGERSVWLADGQVVTLSQGVEQLADYEVFMTTERLVYEQRPGLAGVSWTHAVDPKPAALIYGHGPHTQWRADLIWGKAYFSRLFGSLAQ